MLTFSRFIFGSVAALFLAVSVPAAGSTPATALSMPAEGLPSVCDVLTRAHTRRSGKELESLPGPTTSGTTMPTGPWALLRCT